VKNAPTIGTDPSGEQPPAKPAGQQPPAKPAFTLKTVDRDGPKNRMCGSMSIQVQFRVPEINPLLGLTGFVIQDVAYTVRAWNARGKNVVNNHMHWWEAIPVTGGTSLPDVWFYYPLPGTRGVTFRLGYAVYYDGLTQQQLTDAGWQSVEGGPSGNFPMSYKPPPANWRISSNGVGRILVTGWDCVRDVSATGSGYADTSDVPFWSKV